MAGGTIAPSIRISAVAVLVCALAGCTSPMPVPTPPPTTSESTASPTPTPDPGLGPMAVVTIASMDVDALHVTLAGMVTSLEETGGTCRFIATSSDGTTVERETTGEANVNSTTCGSVEIPSTEFSRGSWDVVIEYTSDAHDAVSEPLRMEIP